MPKYTRLEPEESTYLPFKVDGSQNFSELAFFSRQIFKDFTNFILDSFDKVNPLQGQTFVIGDYGTADGGASFLVIKNCIGRLRQRFGDSIPVQILYEDQPVNDFKPVFFRTKDLMEEFGKVYTMACGMSFYQQCSPDNSVDFILSSCATHWLSRCPLKMTTEIFCEFAPPKELEVFRKQAEVDWETFLLLRSKELKPGGYMVLINCQKGRMTHMGVMTNIWKLMVREDIITQLEFLDTNIMSWYHTPEELRKPFESENSRVSQAGLVLVGDHSSNVPITEDFNKDTTLNTVTETYVENFTATTRAWSEKMLLSGLGNHRTEIEKLKIMNSFYQRFSEYLRASPERVGFDGVTLIGIVVHKLSTDDA